MLLYEKRGKKIGIYKFIPNRDALTEYRRREMTSIPESERVLIAEGHTASCSEVPLFEFYSKNLDSIILSMEEVNSKKNDAHGNYHNIRTDGTTPRNKEILLDCYCQGNLNKCAVARIQDLKQLKYYLLTKTDYEDTWFDTRLKIMKDIIQIPESLYLLQLLEQEKFALIKDEDISKQLSLFNLSRCFDEISLEEFEKTDKYGITKNLYQQTVDKANNDAILLKLLNK